jgi:hypothetical protein
MGIAYKAVTITDTATLPDDVPERPALRDDGEGIPREAALRKHLTERCANGQ